MERQDSPSMLLVRTWEDAFHCFMGAKTDVLAIGNCYHLREDTEVDSVGNEPF